MSPWQNPCLYISHQSPTSVNQNELFTILNKDLTVDEEPQLPSHTSIAEVTNRFVDFLMSKILVIHEQRIIHYRHIHFPLIKTTFSGVA